MILEAFNQLFNEVEIDTSGLTLIDVTEDPMNFSSIKRMTLTFLASCEIPGCENTTYIEYKLEIIEKVWLSTRQVIDDFAHSIKIQILGLGLGKAKFYCQDHTRRIKGLLV